jgi:DNA invertase Pin-like site-specific DNA recombinase
MQSSKVGTRAAIYLRVSKDEQTTENQRPDVGRIVETRRLELVAEYEEKASAVKARPQFEKMMRDAHRGAFNVLVVWALDRFGRSMVGNLQAVLELDRRGVQVVSVREPWLDTGGAVRPLPIAIFSWVAEQERAHLVARTKAGIARARRKGIRIGRPERPVDVRRARALREGDCRCARSRRSSGCHARAMGLACPRRRVASSLKDRKEHAHVLLERLIASERSDRLAKALAMLGRVVRTTFLLRYFHDADVRDRIHLQLNRGEFRHALAQRLLREPGPVPQRRLRQDHEQGVRAQRALERRPHVEHRAHRGDHEGPREQHGEASRARRALAGLAAPLRARHPQRDVPLRPRKRAGSRRVAATAMIYVAGARTTTPDSARASGVAGTRMNRAAFRETAVNVRRDMGRRRPPLGSDPHHPEFFMIGALI